MFAKRVQFDLRENRLTRLFEEKRTQGSELIDLTTSNPTTVGLEYPEERILEVLATPESLRYEPTASGLEKTRKAIAGFYEDRGCKLSPSDLLLTSSTSEAYSFLFKLLLNPGDRVLLPQPSYPLFQYLAAMESVQVAPYHLFYDDGWHYDLESLEDQLATGANVVVLVNPNNPTGSYISRSDWTKFRDLCIRKSVSLICDEVFSEYQLDEETSFPDPRSETEIPLFLLNGLSKSAGLPQLKLSWIAARGPRRIKQQSLSRLELISDTYLSVGTPIQHGLQDLLKLADGIRRQTVARIRTNHESLVKVCSGTAVDPLQVQGGWCATLRVPRSRSEEEWGLHLLESQGIVVHPGYFFDFPGEAYLVLSLLVESTAFEEGVNRLLAAVEG